MNPIKFNNNDKLPKEALIPYKKKQQPMNSIENKQRELIEILEHRLWNKNLENWTERYEKLKAELAALEQQPRNTVEKFSPDFVHSKSTIDTLKVEQPKESTLTAEEKQRGIGIICIGSDRHAIESLIARQGVDLKDVIVVMGKGELERVPLTKPTISTKPCPIISEPVVYRDFKDGQAWRRERRKKSRKSK